MKPQKNYDRISKEVFQLPPDERADLAKKLIESLDSDIDNDTEIAWQREVARRIREIDNDNVKMIPYEEVRKRIRGQ